jgi:sugar phosphate isomerase/epimerase
MQGKHQEAFFMAGIALQLYTLREPAKTDLPGTLKRVREIGWKYVQWSGMPDLPAEKIREALDAADLKAIAAHCGVEPFEKDFDNQVKFWKTVGVTDVAPGGMMDDCRDTLEDWLKGAKRLDMVGAKLREVGMRLSYHNHSGEFENFPGNPHHKLDVLYESTSPKNLFCEFDLAWVQVGGEDPAYYMRKYSGRCPVIHAKDLAAEWKKDHVKFAPLGKGVLNWTEIFKAGVDAKVEWYVYEQDSCDGDPFECAKISYEFLSKNVK